MTRSRLSGLGVLRVHIFRGLPPIVLTLVAGDVVFACVSAVLVSFSNLIDMGDAIGSDGDVVTSEERQTFIYLLTSKESIFNQE